MKKQIIAVDIDDVIALGTESLRLQVNKRLGTNLQPKHYAIPGEYWGYYDRVWQLNGLADRISLEDLNPQMLVDQSHVPPHAQALSALRTLAKRFDLVVVTARNTDWERATKVWIDKNFPGIFSGIYYAGRPDGPKTKGDVCVDLGASWLIDDNIDHAHTAIDHGVQVLLFGEYGWHIGREVHKNVVRCKDWQAVLEYFDGRS